MYNERYRKEDIKDIMSKDKDKYTSKDTSKYSSTNTSNTKRSHKQMYLDKYSSNTVSNFIANNSVKSLIDNSRDKKYVSTKHTHGVMLSRAELEKQKQEAIKDRLYDAVAVRTKELINKEDISIKDLAALAIKTMPSKIDGKIEHEYPTSFLDVVIKANKELEGVIDV